MKFKQDLIQKLRNGEIYLRKDNSKIAREVLMHAFPQDKYLSEKQTPVFDKSEFFTVYCVNKNFWLEATDSYKPAINATDFVEDEQWMPKRGERVLVWDDEGQEFIDRIFLTYIYGAIYPYVVVAGGWDEEFEAGKEFVHVEYKHAKPLPEKEAETERWPDLIEIDSFYARFAGTNDMGAIVYRSGHQKFFAFASIEELKFKANTMYYADNK